MAAPSGYNTTNVKEQGGSQWDVGGTLLVNSGGTQTVESGGTLNVAAGGHFQLGGVSLTPTAAEINTLHNAVANPVVMTMITFTEPNASTSIAGTVTIPAGAVVQDVILKTQVQWNAGTSAAMSVGDADAATGYLSAVNLKTQVADAAAVPAGISNLLSQTGSGAYKGAYKYYPAGGTITATATKVGTGTAGRSVVIVIYSLPATSAAA